MPIWKLCNATYSYKMYLIKLKNFKNIFIKHCYPIYK